METNMMGLPPSGAQSPATTRWLHLALRKGRATLPRCPLWTAIAASAFPSSPGWLQTAAHPLSRRSSSPSLLLHRASWKSQALAPRSATSAQCSSSEVVLAVPIHWPNGLSSAPAGPGLRASPNLGCFCQLPPANFRGTTSAGRPPPADPLRTNSAAHLPRTSAILCRNSSAGPPPQDDSAPRCWCCCCCHCSC
jgi:hypothetical protein